MTVDVSQLHQVFLEESLEHLANMESALLQFEEGGNDPEVINVIFRGAHSIKGGGATFGFRSVAEFTHLVETLLERIRAGQIMINAEIITALFESVDVLRGMINSLQVGKEMDETHSTFLQRQLTKLLARSGAEVSRTMAEEGKLSAPEHLIEPGWRIRFRPYRHFFRTGNDPYRILRELSALGHLEVEADVSVLPGFMELDPEECYLGWDMLLLGRIARADIDEVFAWVEGDCELNIQALTAAREDATPVTQVRQSTTKPAAQMAERRGSHDRRQGDGESVRVSIEKIDAIINMVGELVITQSMLSQVGTTVVDLGDTALDSLRDGLAQLERNTRELQEGVMRIRMLPINFAFSRIPRLVHDLSSKLGKKVELKLSGEQTELDKAVMEKIGDPLVHLVRNSLDHGIEGPAVRHSQGKPEVGQIHLNAYHQGGNIVIEISDDGAGLNLERITAKARERGLLPAGVEIDDQQIIDLIFEPGFSTADTVSDVSGRGVGMDVVRRNIRDLGGNVEVRSQMGQGACFTIRLPLTLAILDGQLVRVGDQIYITPMISIVESLQVRPDRVNSVAGRAELYRLRDDYIPIMDLRREFEVNCRASDAGDGLLVVVEAEGKRVGLLVDDLLGQQQVVIKSLENNFRRVRGVSGATILGDGTVALILDGGQLVNAAGNTSNTHSVRGETITAA